MTSSKLRLLPWKLYTFLLLFNPFRLIHWLREKEEASRAKIPADKLVKRQRIAKRLYLACFIVLLVCGVLWWMVGGLAEFLAKTPHGSLKG